MWQYTATMFEYAAAMKESKTGVSPRFERVLLYVGPPKTGTTSIQGFVWKNREQIQEDPERFTPYAFALVIQSQPKKPA